jgi:hypothetical protein
VDECKPLFNGILNSPARANAATFAVALEKAIGPVTSWFGTAS